MGVVFLAAGLRHVTLPAFAPAPADPAWPEFEDTEMFSQSLDRGSWEPQGYVITLLLYTGGCALAMQFNLGAAALFALCAFLIVWTRTSVPAQDSGHDYRRAAWNFAGVVLPALLITVWALLDGAAHRSRDALMSAARASGKDAASAKQETRAKSSAYGPGGYESLILLPFPEKKPILPPLQQAAFLAPGTSQPLIVPFNGQYWYLQPPNRTPGPTAHRAHGTPLGAEIASIDSRPLVMDAHQTLAVAIPIARCREIQVEIENRDNRIGAMALAVLLTDSAASGRPTLYLGQQAVLSAEPSRFTYKTASVFETLHFAVPARAKLRRFDEITVMMLPDVEHALVGPKIAIGQFRLFPR